MSTSQLRGKEVICREWVFNKIQRCLDGDQRGVIIIGGPGSGKTSICCEILWPTISDSKQNQLKQNLLAYYIIPPSLERNNLTLTCDFIKNIHQQLHKSFLKSHFQATLPEPIHLIKSNPDEVFNQYILKPLSSLNPEGRFSILVDALDDLKTLDRSSDVPSQCISELLVRNQSSFPSWFKLICTTRKHGSFFEGFKKIRLDDLRKSHVVRDVQQFILHRLNKEDKLKQQLDRKTAEMLNQLHIKSDGCFLYLEKSLDIVAYGLVPLQEIRDIPSTLNGFYLWLCQKLFTRVHFNLIKPLLSVIFAYGELNSTVDNLFKVINLRFNNTISKQDFDERLYAARFILLSDQFPHERKIFSTDDSLKLFIFHHSFSEWSLDVKYCTRRFLCKLSDGHASLALNMIADLRNTRISNDVVYELSQHLLKSDFRLEPYHLSLMLLYSQIDLSGIKLETTDGAFADPLIFEILSKAGAKVADSFDKDLMVSSFSGDVLPSDQLDNAFDDDLDDQCDQDSSSSSQRNKTKPCSALASAAFQGNSQLVQLLLDATGSDMLEKRDPKTGQTPLMLASRHGHHEIVSILLAAGANYDSVDFEGWSSLKAASWGGHLECVRLLLEIGADPDKCDVGGRSPLGAACWCGHEDIVKQLLDAGVLVDRQDDDGRSPLMSACYLGHLTIVKLLLAFGADPNLIDPEGRTALIVACSGVSSDMDPNLSNEKNKMDIVEVLLEAGADVTVADVDGVTALTVAACDGKAEMCEVFLEHDADVDWEDVEGRTAIDWAVMMGHAAVVKMLLFWGASVDAIDPDGRTLLGNASQQGSCEVVMLLLDRGLDEMHRDNYGWTSLHIAAYEGHEKVVQILLEAGAHADEQDNEGRTPLYLACQQGNTTVVTTLIQSGMCSPDAPAHDLRTPLMVAGACGKMEVFRILLACGAVDPSKKDAFGRSVLHWVALENGSDMDALSMVELLARKFPTYDVNQADDEGQSVLHCCAWLGRMKLIEMLVKVGADPNCQDFELRTPLILAAWQDNGEVVELLLKLGAKPGLRSRDGASALAVALQENHESVVRVLLRHGKINLTSGSSSSAQKQQLGDSQVVTEVKDHQKNKILNPSCGGKIQTSESSVEEVTSSLEAGKIASDSELKFNKPMNKVTQQQKKQQQQQHKQKTQQNIMDPSNLKHRGSNSSNQPTNKQHYNTTHDEINNSSNYPSTEIYSDGSNPRYPTRDPQSNIHGFENTHTTTTTTTSGVSSMEMTFSNSFAACNSNPGSNSALAKSITGPQSDLDEGLDGKGLPNKLEKTFDGEVLAGRLEADSSGSSGDVRSGISSRNQQLNDQLNIVGISQKSDDQLLGTKHHVTTTTATATTNNSNNTGIDFTRELDRLSNPRNRSFRVGIGHFSAGTTSHNNGNGNSNNNNNINNNNNNNTSTTTHSTSDSNRSFSSDKPNVSRRLNRKKRDLLVGDQLCHDGKSFDVCCVGRKSNRKHHQQQQQQQQ